MVSAVRELIVSLANFDRFDDAMVCPCGSNCTVNSCRFADTTEKIEKVDAADLGRLRRMLVGT